MDGSFRQAYNRRKDVWLYALDNTEERTVVRYLAGKEQMHTENTGERMIHHEV